jgi:catechol 2,3-dioxygenase
MSTGRPSGPSVNHLVLTVRDLAAADRFYTEQLGFEKCGELTGPLAASEMWFYRGHTSSHHDFALVQVKDPAGVAPARPWEGFFPEHAVGINHIAIGYPTREEWLARLKQLQDNGVQFIIRGNHGMTHSAYISDPDGHGIEVLYELPAEVWEGDINAALNFFELVPTEGPESLADSTDYQRFEPAT